MRVAGRGTRGCRIGQDLAFCSRGTLLRQQFPRCSICGGGTQDPREQSLQDGAPSISCRGSASSGATIESKPQLHCQADARVGDRQARRSPCAGQSGEFGKSSPIALRTRPARIRRRIRQPAAAALSHHARPHALRGRRHYHRNAAGIGPVDVAGRNARVAAALSHAAAAGVGADGGDGAGVRDVHGLLAVARHRGGRHA